MMLSEIMVTVAADTSATEEPQTESDEKPVHQVKTIKDEIIEKQQRELIDIKAELQQLSNTFGIKCTESSYLSKGYVEEKRLRMELHNEYVEARTDANELVEINTDLKGQLQKSTKKENELSAICEEKESLIKKKEEELMNLKVQYDRVMTFKKDQSLREKLMNKNIGEKLGERNEMVRVLEKERKLKKQLDQSHIELIKDYDLLKRANTKRKIKNFNLTNQVKKMQDQLEISTALEKANEKELEDLKMKHEKEISMMKEEAHKLVLELKNTIKHKNHETEELIKELEIEKHQKDDLHKEYIRVCNQNTESNKMVIELTKQLNEQSEQLRASMDEREQFVLKCEEMKEMLKTRDDELKDSKLKHQKRINELQDGTEGQRFTIEHDMKYLRSEFACYNSPRRHGDFTRVCENGTARISGKTRKVIGNANVNSAKRTKMIDVNDRVDTGYWSSTSSDNLINRINGHGKDSNKASMDIRSGDINKLNLSSFYDDSAHRLRTNGAFYGRSDF